MYVLLLLCFMYMLVCKVVYAGCEGAGSFAGGPPSLAIIYCICLHDIL